MTTTIPNPLTAAIDRDAAKWQAEAARIVHRLGLEGWFDGDRDDSDLDGAAATLAAEMRKRYMAEFADELRAEPGFFDDADWHAEALPFVREQL